MEIYLSRNVRRIKTNKKIKLEIATVVYQLRIFKYPFEKDHFQVFFNLNTTI